jgi:hypothetical protein
VVSYLSSSFSFLLSKYWGHTCLEIAYFAGHQVTAHVQIVHTRSMNTMMMKNIACFVGHLPMVHALIARTESINTGVAPTNASIADRALWARAQIVRTESTNDNFKAILLRKPYEYGLHE